MIKGLYAAVTAMVVNSTKQQVLAHNIANLQTPGFKQVLSTVQNFTNTGVVYSPGNLLKDTRLNGIGSLGLGAEYGPEFIDLAQGGLESTENPYDLAIEGNGFFRVNTPDGMRYTRDGRFLRDAQNTLVTIDGYQVLNDNNQPIKLPEGPISVSPEGNIMVNGAQAAKLGISSFKDPQQELKRDQGNMFTGPAQSTGETDVRVAQGYLEMSNANASYLTTEMIQVSRSYEAAQKMVQNEDELLGKSIASLGRIG